MLFGVKVPYSIDFFCNFLEKFVEALGGAGLTDRVRDWDFEPFPFYVLSRE